MIRMFLILIITATCLNCSQERRTDKFTGELVSFSPPWTSPFLVDPDFPHHLVNREGEHLLILNKTAWAYFACKDPEGVLKRAAAQGANVIRICLEGAPYFKQLNMDCWPWGGTRQEPDFSKFNETYWEEAERRIKLAGEHGIGINLSIYFSLSRQAEKLPNQRDYWDYALMLRHITGMELQDYLDKYIAKELGWGRWSFGYKYAPQVTHTPGGGGIALRATDMLRFCYLLMNEGKWENKQVVPAWYIKHCSQISPYNPHYPYSLQFNVNTDGFWHKELPHDAYWKIGSGNHCFYIVPSLKLVVWKLGGRDGQYDPSDIGIPTHPEAQKEKDERKDWKRTVTEDLDETMVKTLELVIGSIEKK